MQIIQRILIKHCRSQQHWNHGHLDEGRDLRKEQSPFIFPSCSQTLAYLQWWKMRKKRTISERKKEPQKSPRKDKIAQRLHVSYV